MKRREFIKTSAAVAASLGLPAGAIGAASSLAGTGGLTAQEATPTETVTRLRIGTHKTADLRQANRLAREGGRPRRQPDPPDDDNNYWADAIQRGDEFFYRVGDTTVPISEHEYRMVIGNPNMYYFSSALKLHFRIKHAREGKTIS
jgi:TAT (twin-arginine translocation) pathway signal sequence